MFNFRTTPAFTAADAVREAAAGRLTVIDVRGHDEVARTGKAGCAVHIPLNQIQTLADPRHPDCVVELKSGRPVAVYCASGNRSGMATQALRTLGYPSVHNIGGLGDWLAAGGEVA